MTRPLSVGLFSVTESLASDLDGTIARIARLGYDAVEPVLRTGTPPALMAHFRELAGDRFDLFNPTIDARALRRALDANGLTVSACHVYLPEGDAAEAVFDEQEALGNRLLVAPGIFDADCRALEDFSDPDRVKRLAERFNVAAAHARSRGMRIGYHNHSDDVAIRSDGRSGLEAFFELVEPDVFAEVDVYWALVGGRDPAQLIGSLGERVALLHLKDGSGVAGERSCALGDGIVDVASILDAAPHVTWLTVELDLMGAGVWAALQKSREHLAAGEPAVATQTKAEDLRVRER